MSVAPSERRAQRVIGLCHALLSERGEVSGARLASDALDAYRQLDARSLDRFFDLLSTQFVPSRADVECRASVYAIDPSPSNLIALQRAVEPPRQELFRRLNMAPGATGVLVQMRQRLLATLEQHPHRAAVEFDLAHLLKSWFNRGFLRLQRIDWRTSAIVLERLIQYEAVHEIAGWHDLRRRLQDDRRCYAYFHPALPEEPLIFIEVALTRHVTSHVQRLLDPDSPVIDPATATCAVFYSITSCQDGLRGISFGNFLIKQVVESLGRELRGIRTFATLSPVPGFRRWLTSEPAARERMPDGRSLVEMLDGAEWRTSRRSSAALRRSLMPLCARYLVDAKQRDAPLDAVARFHLANGARLERLNWLGDTSPHGLERSAGIMVNYVYRLADVERNHEAYAKAHKIVSSRRIERLARGADARLPEPVSA
ncbi:MAG: malonyl-CoA decarboxylase [Vicinamibacterales bacterium]